MKTSEFDYQLNPERIAQTPVEPRDLSRLMVVNRADGSIEHRRFREIGAYLSAGDLLIFNDSRVIPARLFAHKLWPPRPGQVEPQKGGRVELLLLDRRENGYWRALVRGKRVRKGLRLAVTDPETQQPSGVEATVVRVGERGERLLAFDPPLEIGKNLERVGTVPLPPYIHTSLDDPERYQTVYARHPGSAAAPTAGLHFTPELLLDLRRQGVKFEFVTLHIGLDTFRPVSSERIEEHPMHAEWVELSPQSAEQVNQTRLAGRRVVAVGTTAVRVLESAAQKALGGQEPDGPEVSGCPEGSACPWQTVGTFEGLTDLFIRPGYRFRATDHLITNFHLPRSTLLMLVSAFAGVELIRRAYQAAIDKDYRFYSFGDAMLVL